MTPGALTFSGTPLRRAATATGRSRDFDDVWYQIPAFYFACPATVLGPYDDAPMAPGSVCQDFELEVAAVIGTYGADLSVNEAEQAIIGYTIFNQHWQSGYAKQMIRLLVAVGFDQLNFHRLEAYIDPENELSKRVAMHGGMQYEATRKEFEYLDGLWQDRDVYFKRQENWKDYER